MFITVKNYHIVCDNCALIGHETPLFYHYPKAIQDSMKKPKVGDPLAFDNVNLEDKVAVRARAKEIGWHIGRMTYCPSCVLYLEIFKK